MTGTANARFGLEEMRPDPPRSRFHRWAINAAYLLGCLLMFVGLVQYGRGVVDEYRDMVVKLEVAEARANVAERQLAEMLRHGDQGVLVANIGPDLAGYQLRLVPKISGGGL